MEINVGEEETFKVTPSGLDYALKCKRCHNDLIKSVSDIIDIYLMKVAPEYNLACSNCKFILSLKKGEYI